MATATETVRERRAVQDQNHTDLVWERTQEQALQALRSGKASMAHTLWAKALKIAEVHFDRGDPRLAASLNNHAFALLWQKKTHQANTHFQRAMVAWEESWRWIPWMKPAQEQDEVEAGTFDPVAQDAFYALIRQGQTVTETLWREGRLLDKQGDSWADVKPKSMSDIRRLFAAVFLLPTAHDRRMTAHDR